MRGSISIIYDACVPFFPPVWVALVKLHDCIARHDLKLPMVLFIGIPTFKIIHEQKIMKMCSGGLCGELRRLSTKSYLTFTHRKRV